MYTSEGTGVRKVSSPLLEWCRDNKVECLAPQYPGRAMRLKEPRITSAKGMAQALFPVLSPSLCDPSIPWILIAHSVGTWIAYEFLVLCRERGVPMPRQAFISAMPCPDIPFDARPWRQQKNLNEEEFKDECREWDISDIVFSTSMWVRVVVFLLLLLYALVFGFFFPFFSSDAIQTHTSSSSYYYHTTCMHAAHVPAIAESRFHHV